MTEYGAQALPNMEMMQVMFAPEALIYDSGEINSRWEFRDFQPQQTFKVAGIEPGETTEVFIANSQAYQANLIRFATETYRRAKYDPMQGIFYFTFVDNWPSITWSVLDYHRQAKPGFYALQTAMQPILPSIEAPLPSDLAGQRWVYSTEDDLDFALWVVNDTLAGYPNAQLHWRIENSDRQPILSDMARVHVVADEVSYATTLRGLSLSPGQYRLSLTLEDAQGKPLGYNAFEFAIVVPEEQPQAEQNR